MKDITIFSPPDVKKTLTKTERTILFEQLGLDTEIPFYHFESFNESEDQILDNERFVSDIPALVLKQNVNYIGPITKKKTSKEFSISVQLNTSINAVNKDLSEKTVISSNTQIEVIGIRFSNHKNYFNPIHLKNTQESSSFSDKLLTGAFNLYSWRHSKENMFTFFQSESYLRLNPLDIIVYFSNEEDTLKKLRLIGSYVNYFINYYNSSLLFMYSAIHHHPYGKITNWEYKPPIVIREKPIEKNSILKLMNSVYTNKLTENNSRIVILYDLTDGKLWNIYQFSRLLGLDDEYVLQLIANEKQRQYDNKLVHEGILNAIRQKTEHYKKLYLTRTLFHKNELHELTEKEQNVVDLTYRKDLEFSKHVQKNKCLHLKLLSKVMKSYSSGGYFDKYAWSELKKLIPRGKSTDSLLQCSLCELLVLCPHHYDQFEFKVDIRKMGTSDKNLRLMLLKKYADKSPIKDAYFCKICGEKLVQKFNEYHASFIAGEKVHVTHNIDTVGNKIWKEVRGIIDNQLTFNIVTDINRMTTNISEIIQPFVEDEHTLLQNIKTNTTDVIQNTIYLYMNIYTYASIIRIMSHHPNDIQFKKGFTGFKKKKFSDPKNNKMDMKKGKTGGDEQKGNVNMKLLQDLFKNSLRLIMDTKSSLIQKIPNISIDSIKPLLIRAYKHISQLYIKTEEFNTELPPEYVANSTVYSYLYYAKKKHNRFLKFSDVREVLGVDLLDIPTLDNIINKAKIPEQWGAGSTNSISNLYDAQYVSAYNKYAYASFLHFINYVKNNLFTVSVFGSLKHEQHGREFEILNKTETIFKKYLRQKICNVLYLYYNKPYGEYTYKPVDLVKIFCPDGKKHRFDIHIYEKGLTRIEISKKNIDEWMFDAEKNKQFRNLKKTDLKCSVCGILMSEIKKNKENQNLTDILNRNDEVIAFYNLYTFKCPVKDIHIFENEKCTQCGLTKDMLSAKDLVFYEKYKTKFYEELKSKTDKPTVIKHDSPKKVIKFPERVFTQSYTVELSKLLRVPQNVINNIGLIEGNHYDSISIGTINPVETAEELDHMNRVIQLRSYMTTFMIEYEMLRNGRIISPKLEVLVKKWGDVNFKQFPDIYYLFNEQLKYYERHLSNDKLANFILSFMAESLLKLYKHFDENEMKIERDAAFNFIKYIMGKIIDVEKQISDPGILRGKLADIDDDNDDGDAVDAEYDDRDIDVKEDYDPFSLDTSGIDKGELNDNMTTGDD